MEIKFYNQNEEIGKANDLYLYSVLNIDFNKLSEQERYDEIKRKLENSKMNSGYIVLQDNSKINAIEIDSIELRHHNMNKPKYLKIY